MRISKSFEATDINMNNQIHVLNTAIHISLMDSVAVHVLQSDTEPIP